MAQMKTLKNHSSKGYFDVEKCFHEPEQIENQRFENLVKESVSNIHGEDVETEHFSVEDILKNQFQELRKWNGAYHENTMPKPNQLLKKELEKKNTNPRLERDGGEERVRRKDKDLLYRREKDGMTWIRNINGNKVLVKEPYPEVPQQIPPYQNPRDPRTFKKNNAIKSHYYQKSPVRSECQEEDIDKLLDILLEDEDALERGISENKKILSNEADWEENMLIKTAKSLNYVGSDSSERLRKDFQREAKAVTIIAALSMLIMIIYLYFV